jgi:hypothetical protein
MPFRDWTTAAGAPECAQPGPEIKTARQPAIARTKRRLDGRLRLCGGSRIITNLSGADESADHARLSRSVPFSPRLKTRKDINCGLGEDPPSPPGGSRRIIKESRPEKRPRGKGGRRRRRQEKRRCRYPNAIGQTHRRSFRGAGADFQSVRWELRAVEHRAKTHCDGTRLARSI